MAFWWDYAPKSDSEDGMLVVCSYLQTKRGHTSFWVKVYEGVLLCVLVYLAGISPSESVLHGNESWCEPCHSFRLDTGVAHFVTSDIARMLFSGVKGSLPFFYVLFSGIIFF